MGNDPKTSVVDKYHKAHDVPNLYIVDGSSFVTGGRNHPTMTIQALAFRAADHIIREAKIARAGRGRPARLRGAAPLGLLVYWFTGLLV
jgi:choline dehydrogenase-like flavoprotein